MREEPPTERGGPAGRERDRATATTLSYVLTLGISALLVSGLLLAGTGVVEDRRETATREALEVVGQQLSARLAAADRLVAAGGTEVRVTGDFPARVAGTTYRIEVRAGPPPTLVLAATAGTLSVSVTVSAATGTPLAETTVPGGEVVVVYTDAGQLEVRAA